MDDQKKLETNEIGDTIISESKELSSEWKWVRLEEIAEINPRKTEIRENLKNDIDVSFIPMKSVDDKSGKIIEYQTKNINDVYKGYTYFKEADIIFAKITPCMENGKCAIAENLENKIGFGSTEFHVIRLNNNIEKKWVWYLLRFLETRINAKKHFTGAVGHKRVPADFIEEILIPLPYKNGIPDLKRQKNIVKKIDKIFRKLELAEKLRKNAIKKSNHIFSSVLNNIFLEARENEDWKWIKFEKIVNFQMGKTPKRSENVYWDNGIYHWVSIGDMKVKYLKSTKEKVSEKAYNETFKGKLVGKGTLLMSFKLTIGRTSILAIDAFHNEAIISIRPKKSIAKEYLYWILPHINYKDYVNDAIKGLTLNKPILKSILIPIPCSNGKPNLDKQKQISNHLNDLNNKIQILEDLQQKQSQKFTQFKESILNKAFEGHYDDI